MAIKALKPSSSVRRIREMSGDYSLRGFGITISTVGTKSFYIAYTSPESELRAELKGSDPEVSPENII